MEDNQPLNRSKKKLSKQQIIQASLEIIQQEGLKKFSTRKLATKLDIKSSSLYWHVKDKEELMGLIGDEVCKNIKFPEEVLNWKEKLYKLSHEIRKTLLLYRDSAIILAETSPNTPNRKKLIKQIAFLFMEAGFKDEQVFSASWVFNNYISAFVMDEYRFLNIKQKETRASIEPNFENLPFELKIPDMENEFNFGIEILISGFKTKISQK